MWRMASALLMLMALVVVLLIGWSVWTALMPLAFPLGPAAFTRPGFIPFAICWFIAGFLVAAVFPRSE
jgi:hypothetical protein